MSFVAGLDVVRQLKKCRTFGLIWAILNWKILTIHENLEQKKSKKAMCNSITLTNDVITFLVTDMTKLSAMTVG